MYYELSPFFYKDINFCQEKNGIYSIEKIEDKFKEYDILPTIGDLLVSQKFVDTFKELINKEIEIEINRIIIQDEKLQKLHGFYALKVLKQIPCMDKQNSQYTIKKYGKSEFYRITKLVLNTQNIKDESIFLMEEQKGKTIVNQGFKDRFEGLKGFDFEVFG